MGVAIRLLRLGNKNKVSNPKDIISYISCIFGFAHHMVLFI